MARGTTNTQPETVRTGEVPERTVGGGRAASWLRRHERGLLPAATAVALLAAWELYGRLGSINPLFFSYPSHIAQALVDYARGPLPTDLAVSSLEFAVGFALASVAVPLGLVIGTVRRLRLALDPLINGLYATPLLALTPLLVLWFGIGVVSKIAIVALMAFFPLVISTIEGVVTVDTSLLRAARSFGANRWQLHRDVIFPSVLPFVVSGTRLAIGRAIMGVVIGEFIAATAGIGYRIAEAAGVFDTSRLLAAVAILVLAAVLLNLLLKTAETRLARWRPEATW